MYILALESTGAHASVAIIDEKGKTEEILNDGTLNHLETMVPMAKEIIEKCKLQLDDISAIAVSKGPGSFTGIRIGVTTGRTLAQALGIPVIGVPTLDAFCYRCKEYEGIICPVLNARRKQIYGGAFKWQEGKLLHILEPKGYMIDEFLELLADRKEKVTFFGDGIDAYEEEICKSSLNKVFAQKNDRLQRASSVALMALDMYNRGETVSYQKLFPDYMRKAEAERKLEEKLKNE